MKLAMLIYRQLLNANIVFTLQEIVKHRHLCATRSPGYIVLVYFGPTRPHVSVSCTGEQSFSEYSIYDGMILNKVADQPPFRKQGLLPSTTIFLANILLHMNILAKEIQFGELESTSCRLRGPWLIEIQAAKVPSIPPLYLALVCLALKSSISLLSELLNNVSHKRFADDSKLGNTSRTTADNNITSWPIPHLGGNFLFNLPILQCASVVIEFSVLG